ncbi:MAG: glucose-6-phosphate dehydrogenase, partial [Clostridia bacterium]|nr:glucose-6-phosphate dehydrogenase [Deltaproteobacteria bacterium]
MHPVFKPGEPSAVQGMIERHPGACTMVIFGASGDLAKRKLFPALYNLAKGNELPEQFAIVGVSRSIPNDSALREIVRGALEKFAGEEVDKATWERLSRCLYMVTGDVVEEKTYNDLGAAIERAAKEHGTGKSVLFYLSVPASSFPEILPRLKSAKLVHATGSKDQWTRVIVEKPFGHDIESAVELNDLANKTLDESQVFRIDHYLGKETVQNILAFRFANSIFEPLWNRKFIDHVQITAAEKIDIEGRGKFYEETGILRDVVQNHLLQVLALFAMEPPNALTAGELRSEKARMLRAMRPFETKNVSQAVVLGQYEGYRDEKDVAKDSQVPTFTALKLFVDNWRWQGVPFYLRAGKGLKSRVTEIKVVFGNIPLSLFGRASSDAIRNNILTLRIQPDEGIGLSFMSKVPGVEFQLANVDMNMRYSQV